MSLLYTTEKLIASINRKSFAPANQNTYTTDEILAIADEVTQTIILPAILSVREEFFTTYVDIPLVANQRAYDLPARSIGEIYREIKIVNSDGNVKNLTRVEYEELDGTASTGEPKQFYLQDDQIIPYPIPSTSSGSIRVYFYLRPGQLIQATEGATISAINTSTNVVTVSTIPSTWATGDTFDFVKNTGYHSYRGIDYTSTLISSTDITFSYLPSNLAVGDLIAPQGYSPLVQLPIDLRPVLALLTAGELISNQNQPDSQRLEGKGLALLQTAMKSLAMSRVHGEDRVIMPDWS